MKKSLRVLPDLIMSAKRSVWRMHDHAGEADKQFANTRIGSLEAANYTCEFCGFQSSKYQEVHHLDDDHKNNDPRNHGCACPLCHQIFHIGLAGMKSGGELVYVPELTQPEINHLALILWLISETETKKLDPKYAVQFTRLAGCAKTIECALGNRRGTIFARIQAFLKESDFPKELLASLKTHHFSLSLMSNVLMGLTDDEFMKRKELLGGLRIYPDASRFRERIKHWNAEQSSVLPVHAWYSIVSQEAMEEIVLSCTQQLENVLPKITDSTATAG